MYGSLNAVKNICDFEKRILSDIGLKNLLTFLKIDSVKTEFLVKLLLRIKPSVCYRKKKVLVK